MKMKIMLTRKLNMLTKLTNSRGAVDEEAAAAIEQLKQEVNILRVTKFVHWVSEWINYRWILKHKNATFQKKDVWRHTATDSIETSSVI